MVYIPLDSAPEGLRDSLATYVEQLNAAEETIVQAVREREDALRKREESTVLALRMREDHVRQREADLMCIEKEQHLKRRGPQAAVIVAGDAQQVG
jgi:hypothetical protein